jgi:adenylylsulfate kinase
VLIVMAGLPGTGKSALAARLARAVGGVVLSKDVVRAAMFPANTTDFSSEQDDVAMNAVYSAAAYLLTANPARPVLIDGRTFSKPGQISVPLTLADLLGVPARVIECTCADDIARARIASEVGAHLAGNRTPELFDRAKAAAVALEVPRLTLDTAALSLEECAARALDYLRQSC